MSLEEKVRVIPHRVDEAPFSLAIDRALLKLMDKKTEKGEKVDPIIRTYHFAKPIVIMGYNQKVDGRFDKLLAKRKGVDLTSRDTGGGHMYFGKEDIQFSFIAPFSSLNRDLIANYQKINSIVVSALRELGYNVALGRTSIRIGNSNGKIVAGTARRHGKYSFLHQGGILVRNYDEDIFKLLMAREDEIEKWRKSVVSLSEVGNGAYKKFPEVLLRNFKNNYLMDLREEEISLARKYWKELYTNINSIRSGKKEGDICLIAGERSTKNKEQEESL